ncbi:MAG: PilT/PilU family type 4a pilus ATPase, partial [Oscillospiraceae bacterium]|nr:PilT/PilU family type 4a pilus ATPase [Oscillospiraceae bacterium]
MSSSEIQIEGLLERSIQARATDIHITVGSPPMFRVGGMIAPVEGYEPLKPAVTKGLAESIMGEDQRRAFEENGEVDFSFSRPGKGRYRVNVYSQRGTNAIALRALPLEIPPFESLGIPEAVKQFARKQKGLILTSGISGSGKSTTMAALIDMINAEQRKLIITIEDPIEFLHKHKSSVVVQREVGGDTRSFSAALRAALREDPDVILVGEMRDPETISIALTAAETGHLVLSTIHTLGAAKSMDRIIDGFPPNQQNQIRSQLATVLEGVVSQQLVPTKEGRGVILATEILMVTPAVRNLI